MSVRFMLGRSGSGKTTTILTEIREQLITDPEGPPIIYIVPDQMTFQSEYQLISAPNVSGMIRAQVFSFTRLAWRILQETGGISRQHLNSVGINMLIRKIIEDQKEHLTLFQKAADKNGFVQQMEQMLTEFKRYCIHPEELAEKQAKLADGEKQTKAIQDKLHDLQLIYARFEEELTGKYLDSEDYFRLLAEKVAVSTYLQQADIYIDGFHSFTPQEYMIIAALMKRCNRVTIALTLDQPFSDVVPDELHLFRQTGETCQTLMQMVKGDGIKLEEMIVVQEQHRSHGALQHLEKFFDERPARIFSEEPNIITAQAVNRRAEIEGVARTIKQSIRDSGHRFRDFAVLVRNGSEYHDIIESIFYDFDIPFFIDQKRTMLNHPLVELIRSTLEIINGNWRYEPVFRAVKTELLFPKTSFLPKLREQMDELENYVLAYGIQGDKWTKRNRWIYRRIRGLELENIAQTDHEKQVEQQLNELRLIITAPILRLTRRLKKAETGQELCEALFLYLEELEIPTKLERLKLAAEEKGRLLVAREHEQAWNAIIDLLDQFVEILGEEKISLKEFATILDSGMESLRFSVVPPALDQVIVADLEKSRLYDVKVAFVIGLNEGVLPAKFSEEGILADSDREELLRSGMKIAPSSRTRLLDENFIAYKALTTPSEQLFISYPIADEEGKALMPSSYIKRIEEMFPERKELFFVNDPAEQSELEQLEYVENERTTLAYLTAQLQLKKRGYPIYELWWDVYNYYMRNMNLKEPVRNVLSSLFYQNETTPLSADVTNDLYGDLIQVSVSRMELFNSCPFSHFAQHGLKLRDRHIYRLEAPDIGELFHAALKEIAEHVNKHDLTWASLTRQQCDDLANTAVNKLAPKLQNEILLSSNRHHYIKRKLEQIISRASYILSEHAKASGFSPVGLELGFGPKGDLPPLAFTLKTGAKMELQGRIDRVDKAQEGNDVFLRIVDYKSSAKDINLSDVYYGLSLQMLTYLDIVITYSKQFIGMEATPAGVLYFHVQNPIIQASKLLSMDEIEQEIFKKFKMNGLILSDENVIRLMDNSLESGDSQIIAAGIKKDGTLSKRSKVASTEEFQYLRQYVRNQYVKTGNQIVNGAVEIAPYQIKDKTPCTFCSFKPVCQFDPSIEPNDYRVLSPKKKEDVLEIIRMEVEASEQ